ncbi:MAG: ribonuclease P protein component [Ruminococcaceae bacterium]|nr:ribonuclease P protein component [Oscillospiraceae bacterium]
MNRKLYPLCENHMFLKAYRKGKSGVNKYIAVYVLKNYRTNKDGSPVHTKLGLAVNAKLGKACKRSRVKRIIREAYRMNLSNIADGYIIVIAARAAIFSKNVKSTDVEKQLGVTLSKLGVLK